MQMDIKKQLDKQVSSHDPMKSKYLNLKRAMSKKMRELEDVKKEFFYFLEHQRDGAIIVDLAGRITFSNKASLNMCGYEKDEVMGRHFRMFMSLDDLAEGFKLFYNVLKGEYSTFNMFRIRNKDGTTRIVEVNASPLHQFGKVVGGVAIIRDISARNEKQEGNKERIEKFVKLDKDAEQWKHEVADLHEEVDNLRCELGKEKKYGTE